ncbi:hypothetical protein V5F53_02695 [Xanthobacter sp. V4C-4]|uniref:hypothetical protein n=1 Tax=Xanthobacter cornucopiae TaxID=3119924 RepID=UPI003726FAA3
MQDENQYENISRTIYLRLPIELARRLHRTAQANDEASASLAKRIVIRELNAMTQADHLPPVVTPRRPPRQIINEDAALIGTLASSIGRLTGATIQLAKSVREAGADNVPIERALSAIRAAAAKILELHDKLKANP